MSIIDLYFAQHTSCTLVFHPQLTAPPSFGWLGRSLCYHALFPSLGRMFHVSHEDVFLTSEPILSPIRLDYPGPHCFSWITAPPCLVPKAFFHTNTLQITLSSECSVAPWLCLDVSVDCKGPAWPTASMTPSASAPSLPAALVPYPDG